MYRQVNSNLLVLLALLPCASVSFADNDRQQNTQVPFAGHGDEIDNTLAASDTARSKAQVSTDSTAADWFQSEPEFGLELGILTFYGTDIHITYRQKQSPWLFAFRYANWTEPPSLYHGKIENEVAGLHTRYLFEPDADSSWFLAAAWLEQNRKLTCEITGDSDTDSATGLYLGGGYTGWRNKALYYNWQLLLSPSDELIMEADGCSERITATDTTFSIGINF